MLQTKKAAFCQMKRGGLGPVKTEPWFGSCLLRKTFFQTHGQNMGGQSTSNRLQAIVNVCTVQRGHRQNADWPAQSVQSQDLKESLINPG